MTQGLTGTQANVQIAERKEHYNNIMLQASNDYKIITDGAGTFYYLSELEAMTEDQVKVLWICGIKGTDQDGNPIINTTGGFTKAASRVLERADKPGEYFTKKIPSLMTGVTNVTEKTIEDDWYPDE